MGEWRVSVVDKRVGVVHAVRTARMTTTADVTLGPPLTTPTSVANSNFFKSRMHHSASSTKKTHCFYSTTRILPPIATPCSRWWWTSLAVKAISGYAQDRLLALFGLEIPHCAELPFSVNPSPLLMRVHDLIVDVDLEVFVFICACECDARCHIFSCTTSTTRSCRRTTANSRAFSWTTANSRIFSRTFSRTFSHTFSRTTACIRLLDKGRNLSLTTRDQRRPTFTRTLSLHHLCLEIIERARLSDSLTSGRRVTGLLYAATFVEKGSFHDIFESMRDNAPIVCDFQAVVVTIDHSSFGGKGVTSLVFRPKRDDAIPLFVALFRHLEDRLPCHDVGQRHYRVVTIVVLDFDGVGV